MSGYLLFAAVFAASVATPGPDVAALIARALSAGPRASFAMLCGVIIGKLILLATALMGLAMLFQALGPWFLVVKIAGAGYLIWLGVKTWRRAGRRSMAGAPAAAHRLGDVALGVGTALANPIAVMFYVALLPSVVDIGAVGSEQVFILGGLVVALTLATGGAYIALAAAARRLIAGETARRRIDQGAGAALIGAGVAVAAR